MKKPRFTWKKAIIALVFVFLLSFSAVYPRLPYCFDAVGYLIVPPIYSSMTESIEINGRILSDGEIACFLCLYNHSVSFADEGGTTPDFSAVIRFRDGSRISLSECSSVSLSVCFTDTDGNSSRGDFIKAILHNDCCTDASKYATKALAVRPAVLP